MDKQPSHQESMYEDASRDQTKLLQRKLDASRQAMLQAQSERDRRGSLLAAKDARIKELEEELELANAQIDLNFGVIDERNAEIACLRFECLVWEFVASGYPEHNARMLAREQMERRHDVSVQEGT